MSMKIKTPFNSKWELKGEKDPHGNQYQCERNDLVLGEFTDDELANAVFLHGDNGMPIANLFSGEIKAPIVYLTAAKDRIRWLSRQKSKLEKEIEQLKALVPPKNIVWISREEFSHYTYISEMSPVKLYNLRNFVDSESEGIKKHIDENFHSLDGERLSNLTEDEKEWSSLSDVLTKEIEKLGGL